MSSMTCPKLSSLKKRSDKRIYKHFPHTRTIDKNVLVQKVSPTLWTSTNSNILVYKLSTLKNLHFLNQIGTFIYFI